MTRIHGVCTLGFIGTIGRHLSHLIFGGGIKHTEGFKEASAGKVGFGHFVDERGAEVFASYRSIELPGGIKWYALVEREVAEVMHLEATYKLLSMVLGISFALILAFSWAFSSTLARQVAGIAARLKESAAATSQQSMKMKDASQNVSSSATEQASAIQETVATLDEITSMVNKSVDYANKSAEKSATSQKVTTEGQRAVTEMVRAMDDISGSNTEIMKAITDSNQKIAGIVKVIQSIAEKTNVINDIVFQTKLLSFNASVEAARAGEHGKGFAVVAEEVGNLAQMSGNAAKEIGEMLSSSIEKVEAVVKETEVSITRMIESGRAKVESGVHVAKRCGEVFDEVVENVSAVSRMMEEVAQASKEQAEGVNNISTAMNQLDEATHMNSNTANETSVLAEELARQASMLEKAVRDLELQVNGTRAVIASHEEAHDDHQAHPQKPAAKVTPIRTRAPKAPAKSGGVAKKASGAEELAANDVPSKDDPRFEEI